MRVGSSVRRGARHTRPPWVRNLRPDILQGLGALFPASIGRRDGTTYRAHGTIGMVTELIESQVRCWLWLRLLCSSPDQTSERHFSPPAVLSSTSMRF